VTDAPGIPDTAPLTRADHLTKRFGDFTAVDDVTLHVMPGEIVGLIGANGAGKTTLIRMLLGLLRPSTGSAELFGIPPSRRERARLGYVPQGLGLYTDMTVDENLQFVAQAFGTTPGRLPEELEPTRHRLVGDIGLGRQRQVAFTAALGHHPALLVLDEPTSGVDPLARARLWDIVHRQADAGVGVLITTHYMQEAQQCDRLAILADGQVVVAGTLDDVIGGRTAVRVQSDDWQSAFRQLVGADLAVTLDGTDVRVIGATPEQVRAALGTADVTLTEVPATLDEIMTLVATPR
jgi:ABC-type multidrug transport system ATPase subunit